MLRAGMWLHRMHKVFVVQKTAPKFHSVCVRHSTIPVPFLNDLKHWRVHSCNMQNCLMPIQQKVLREMFLIPRTILNTNFAYVFTCDAMIARCMRSSCVRPSVCHTLVLYQNGET